MCVGATDAEEMLRSLGITAPTVTKESEGINAVVGAEGGLGRAVVDALLKESLKVRAVLLGPAKAGFPFSEGVETATADPLRPDSLANACAGAYTIYDCFEPGYKKWRELTSSVASRLVLASIDGGTTLVLASHLMRAESDNSKLENEVIAANRSRLTRTVVVRIPQLYGPRVVNGLWQMIFESAIKGNKAHWMGNLNAPRSLLYVNDAAVAIVLLGRSLWGHGRVWTIAGPPPLTGRRFIELAFMAAGREPQFGSWGRGVVLTGSLLASNSKELLALPYDYYSPFVLDGSEFATAFPSWKYTPHEEAIKETLGWYKSRSTANSEAP
jgi:nucleoside-diphosphate-sugar epimerase